MKLQCSTESLSDRASNRFGFRCSPHVLGVARWTTGSSHDRAPDHTRKNGRVSSLELPLSYRVRCSPSGPRLHPRPKPNAKPLAPPVRFPPLQRLPVQGSGTKSDRASQARPAYAFRFSQPRGVFVRPWTCWPCFMPDPLMGFTLQSFAPPVQPYAVSSAVALLSLERLTVLPEEPAYVASAEALRQNTSPP
jgi:hypothetical protein